MDNQAELLVGNLSETAAHGSGDGSGHNSSIENDGHRRMVNGDESARQTISRVAVIERRSLMRECLIRSLAAATGWNVVAYASAGAWLEVADKMPVSLVALVNRVRRQMRMLTSHGWRKSRLWRRWR
jgi:hypothetical protein